MENSLINKDFSVQDARKISEENRTNDLDFYINSIRDRAGRGLYIAAFSFVPKEECDELSKRGFLVERKQDNYIEVSWYPVDFKRG